MLTPVQSLFRARRLSSPVNKIDNEKRLTKSSPLVFKRTLLIYCIFLGALSRQMAAF